MRISEYGNYLRFNLNRNINLADVVVTLISSRTDEVLTLNEDNGLQLGNANVEITDEVTYIAGQYVEYQLPKGFFPVAGTWIARATLTEGDVRRQTDGIPIKILS